MRHFLAATLFAASAVLGENSDPTRDTGAQEPFSRDVVPGAYIVELGSVPGKRAVHDDFLGELDKRAGGKFAMRKKYTSPIFNGIAVQLNTSADVVDLASIPNVVSVRPVFKYLAPKPVHLDLKPVSAVPSGVPFGQSVHMMTGVDKVHAQGLTGKGVKIGIIDSGVDYMHPNLGGGFGPGFKVAGGYDFVGDRYYPGQIPPQPDDDPLDTCEGHGTHVAGIIGANPGNEFNVTGVAYEASLYAYRVFGCYDATGDDVIIDAMLRAYDDGMDIITMSIGRSAAWSDEPLSIIASRIAALGTVFTVSAGNEGRSGPFFPSTPASGKDVIAVGSVENTVRMYQTLTASVDHAPIPYLAVDPASDLDGFPFEVSDTPLPIYAPALDPLSRTTACSELGDDVPDLSGHIVVFRAVEYVGGSSCYVEDQIINLGNKGARTFLIYDVDVAPYVWQFETRSIFLRDREDGVFLVNEFNKAHNLTVTFAKHGSGIEIPNEETGGLMSSYSSFGPTQDLLFKPALSAPGGNITSTWLTNAGGWAVASGTSMSAPYTAGSAALLIQARSKAVAKNARTIFQSTAVGLPVSRDSKALPQTLSHQGAGLMNVFNALNTRTEVSPAELLLNDTAHWKAQHNIVIKNNGIQRQTYVLSHQPAGTALTMPTRHLTTTYPVPLVDAPVTVRLSQTRVTLSPGASITVTVGVIPPKNVDPKTLPLVSGWIRVDGSLGDRLRVSYLGVAGSMYEAETISTQNAGMFGLKFNLPSPILPQGFEDFEDFPQIGPANFSRGKAASPFNFILAQNSARVVVDLIDAHTKVHATVPILNKKRSLWSGWWLPGMPIEKTGGNFDDIPIVTRIAEGANALHIFSGTSPIYRVYFPYYINGTDIPYGQYRYLLRALRPFGDPKLENDYDVYVSDSIGIVEGEEDPL